MGILLGPSILNIAIDQILWYFDCVGYVFIGKFKVGVAKYLIWPDTHWTSKITATHHLWFIPFVGYILARSGGLKFESWYLSAIAMTCLWIVSRHTVPKTLKNKKDDTELYMNVNLAYELWKDVKIRILEVLTKDVPYVQSVTVTMFFWNLFNLCCFGLLKIFM